MGSLVLANSSDKQESGANPSVLAMDHPITTFMFVWHSSAWEC